MVDSRMRRVAWCLVAALAVALSTAFAGGRPDAPVETDVWLGKRSRLYFEVWSQRGLGPRDVEIIERNLNAVRREIGRDFAANDRTRYQVILTDSAVFRRYSGAGEHVAGLFDGKIHIPIPSEVDERELQGVLWHEYTHAVIFTKTGGRCPVWLNEGLASYQQSKIDPRRRQNVNRLLRPDGTLPYTWAELEAAFRSPSAASQAVAYLQAFAVADYLFERYRRYQLNALLDEIAKSGDAVSAFDRVLHTSLDKLERKVIEHVRKQ